MYDDYRWKEKEINRYFYGAVSLFGVLGWLFYHHWLGAAISGLLSVPFRGIYERYRLDGQRKKGYQELREILYILSSGFASGLGLKEGAGDCCNMLRSSYGDQSLLLNEMEVMVRAMEEGNASEVGLFHTFAERIGFPELKQTAAIYRLCLRTGGDLPKAMIETSDSMLRRLQLYQDLQSKTAQKRLEFLIMSTMVPMLLISVNAASDYLAPLYSSLEGRCLMTIGLVGSVSAFVWSFKILEGGRP